MVKTRQTSKQLVTSHLHQDLEALSQAGSGSTQEPGTQLVLDTQFK